MRKKTYDEKAMAGTIKLERIRENKLTITQVPPKPQPYLTNSGKRIFRRICLHIIEHKILCDIDSFALSILAHNLDIYQRMVKEIEAREKREPMSGYFQTFANGTQQKSPQVNMMDKAEDSIFKYAKEFGLTVKSRDSILAFSKNPTGEEEEEGEELRLN